MKNEFQCDRAADAAEQRRGGTRAPRAHAPRTVPGSWLRSRSRFNDDRIAVEVYDSASKTVVAAVSFRELSLAVLAAAQRMHQDGGAREGNAILPDRHETISRPRFRDWSEEHERGAAGPTDAPF